MEISEKDDATAQELAVTRNVTHLVNSVYAMHQVVEESEDHAIYYGNDEHGSDGEGDDSHTDDMDLSNAEDAEDDEDDDDNDDGDGSKTSLLQSRLSPIVGGLRLAYFEGTFEKLDQQQFAMQNSNHQLTPEERSYSRDQLYPSVPGGIHQPYNKDYKNLDYGGFLCKVNKSAWAKPEEGKVLLLGMCEISNPWNESTRGFLKKHLQLHYAWEFSHCRAKDQRFSKLSRTASVNTVVL